MLRGLEREVLGLDAVRVRRPARALVVVDDDAAEDLVVERELVRREVDAHGVGAGLEDGAGHVLAGPRRRQVAAAQPAAPPEFGMALVRHLAQTQQVALVAHEVRVRQLPDLRRVPVRERALDGGEPVVAVLEAGVRREVVDDEHDLAPI